MVFVIDKVQLVFFVKGTPCLFNSRAYYSCLCVGFEKVSLQSKLVLPVEMFFLLTCFYLLKCFCLCFCWTFKAKPDPKIPLKNGSSESGADRDWCRDSRLPCLIIIKHRDIVYYIIIIYYNCNDIILIQQYVYRWKCEEGDGKNYKNISLTFNVENINIDNIMLFNRSISFNNII